MRLAAKSKRAEYMSALNKTGHKGPETKLTDNTLRISDIYGVYGTGLSIIREVGFPKCAVTIVKNGKRNT